MGSSMKMFLLSTLLISLLHPQVFGVDVENVSIFNNITKDSAKSCSIGWMDASSVRMGCLYFDNSEAYNWADANIYCNEMDATLVEIDTIDQLDFVVMVLQVIVVIDASHNWWTAGTDQGVEGTWRWISTSEDVPYFVWASGQPGGGTKENCLYLASGSFLGNDYACTGTFYPICQIR